MQPHTYCHYCGTQHTDSMWPRTCGGCKQIHYQNPLPVVVALVPIEGGILTVRRAIHPGFGKLALPGGYLDFGETWQEGCAREVFEETGFKIEASKFTLFDVESASSNGFLLVFAKTPYHAFKVSDFVVNSEVSELAVTKQPIALAFETHTKMLAKYLAE